jgi:hypothetical protein
MTMLGDTSWAETARRGGMSESTLKTLATRDLQQTPRPETWVALAKALDVPLEMLDRPMFRSVRPEFEADGAPSTHDPLRHKLLRIEREAGDFVLMAIDGEYTLTIPGKTSWTDCTIDSVVDQALLTHRQFRRPRSVEVNAEADIKESVDWSLWLQDQLRRRNWRATDLVVASGVKDNGRPVIDAPRVSNWIAGERPSTRLAAVVAQVFDVGIEEVLVASGHLDRSES